MTKEELLSLLADLSPEEKVMQLVQLPGQEFDSNAANTGLTQDQLPGELKALVGSTLSIWGRDKLLQLQKDYMARHPHHIPLLFMLDVIHGHRTVFPCPLGQGASFDPELVEAAAAVQAREASDDGIHVTFSPMADLVRDARWGRVMESTGEDPFLNGKMAAAMVRGYQGDLKPGHLASCVKHFAAYGAAEAGRDYSNTELSEHTLREQYLPGYEAAVKAGAKLVMSSFNTWNGIPCSANPWLLKQVLRSEMGFEGVVISDWNAVGELISHGFAEGPRDAAERAASAGVDIDMCSGAFYARLTESVREGSFPEEELDAAVLRVLTLKNDLGLFEDPFRGLENAGPAEFLTEDARALARKLAARSLVLLENRDDTLPLKPGKLALVGPFADTKELISSWAISAEAADTVTLLQAAGESWPPELLRHAAGCTMLDNDTTRHLDVWHSDSWAEDNAALLRQAEEAAGWADTVVVCLGEDPMLSGESTSRSCLQLPGVQLALLEALRKKARKLVTLIFTGRPLELGRVRALSDALMVCWLPGTEGGHGVWDVLTGAEDPAGRLPMSFPYTVGQEPIHYNAYTTGRPCPEKGPTLFSSRYLDCPNEPLYSFGYGLSYTSFQLSDPVLSSGTLTPDGVITAELTLTNTGSRPGTETVQLYIRDLIGSRVRPNRELKDFRKVSLAPGETCRLSFSIREEQLRFWTAAGRFESEPGSFRVWAAAGSSRTAPAEFRLIP